MDIAGQLFYYKITFISQEIKHYDKVKTVSFRVNFITFKLIFMLALLSTSGFQTFFAQGTLGNANFKRGTLGPQPNCFLTNKLKFYFCNLTREQ